jgi:hypothetical protein
MIHRVNGDSKPGRRVERLVRKCSGDGVGVEALGGFDGLLPEVCADVGGFDVVV